MLRPFDQGFSTTRLGAQSDTLLRLEEVQILNNKCKERYQNYSKFRVLAEMYSNVASALQQVQN